MEEAVRFEKGATAYQRYLRNMEQRQSQSFVSLFNLLPLVSFPSSAFISP